jgi:hypothetical protein
MLQLEIINLNKNKRPKLYIDSVGFNNDKMVFEELQQ